MLTSNVLNFPGRRIGRREQAIRHIRSMVVALLHGTSPDTNDIWPCWNIGNLEISLCRPNESHTPGLWTLDIWTPEQKVMNVMWSPNDDSELDIVRFRRGEWEQQLQGFGEVAA